MNPEDPSLGLLRALIANWINQQGQTADTNVGVQAPQSMQGFLGPMGRLFPHPGGGGVSTEISGVNEHPTMPGKQTFSPLLVPGQVGINTLLQGQRPTWMQHAFAQDWAKQNAQQLPQFNSVLEALASEAWRHQQLDQASKAQMSPYMQEPRFSLLPQYQLSPTYK